MATAPRDGAHVLLILGETIPDLPDIRLGQFVKGREAAEIGYHDYARAGGWFIWNDSNDWFVVGDDSPLAWAPQPIGGPFQSAVHARIEGEHEGFAIVANSATPEGRELGAHLARLCDQEAKKAGRDERCSTCAFRAGEHLANGSVETLMSAVKCMAEREPFWCHEHDRPCAGWQMMRFDADATVAMPWDHVPGMEEEA
jgi:hypothetical protein